MKKKIKKKIMKMTRREYIKKKHGKAYRTLLRNLKEARKKHK